MVKSWVCQAICVVAAALGVGPATAMRSLDVPGASSSIETGGIHETISQLGPYGFKTIQCPLFVPGDATKGSKMQRLALTITAPVPLQHSASSPLQISAAHSKLSTTLEIGESPALHGTPIQPFPLVVLISGFLIPSFWYRLYAHTLASWGYVVLQYDVKSVGLVTDRAEVSFLGIISILNSQKPYLTSGIKPFCADDKTYTFLVCLDLRVRIKHIHVIACHTAMCTVSDNHSIPTSQLSGPVKDHGQMDHGMNV